MAIGERIHFFRILRGMTQKYLGTIVGFPERSADVRLAQYETGTRKPKAELTAALAQALDVSPHALDVPDIDSYIGLMHTLFTLEDLYGQIGTLQRELMDSKQKQKESQFTQTKNTEPNRADEVRTYTPTAKRTSFANSDNESEGEISASGPRYS